MCALSYSHCRQRLLTQTWLTARYSTTQYNAVQYSTIQYNTVQYISVIILGLKWTNMVIIKWILTALLGLLWKRKKRQPILFSLLVLLSAHFIRLSRLPFIFKASALWGNAFNKLKCPYVCLFFCLSVCPSHFLTQFNRLFGPTS